jgi:zinc transport system substrate-binding protein
MRLAAWWLAALVLAAGCTSGPAGSPGAEPQAGAPRRLSVVASFYPLYEFARRIGGDAADVRNLVPAGAEPHDFEPSARDIAALSKASLLVYNGAGFEPWIERLLPGLPSSVKLVDTSAGLPLVRDTAEPGTTKEPAARAGAPGTQPVDPHVWLDPLLARRQVDHVLAGYVQVDAGRQAAYEANAATLRRDLEALHRRYVDTLKSCRIRTFVTAHAAFGYLANRYGLSMIPISGLSPEVEPSPARLRAVVREARKHDIRVIYFETLVSPKVAQTIAREVGARTLVLNPVEGLSPEEQATGATYFTVMDENLRNLATGLDCR